jgi:hypothetical protein
MASCVLLTDNLNKFRSRSRIERYLFLEAFVWLGLMRAAILMLPFRRIVRICGLHTCSPVESFSIIKNSLPERIGWAVNAAAVRTPWESVCLGQALAGMAMLKRRSLPGLLCLGVAKNESGPDVMAAHAWLRSNDTVLTGNSGLDRYSVIACYSWHVNKR